MKKMLKAQTQTWCFHCWSMLRQMLIILVALLFVGCSKTYFDANQKIDSTVDQMHSANHDLDEPSVVTKPGYYVSTKTIPIDNTPAWLNRPVTLHAQHLPFNILMTRLLRYHPLTINYDSDIQRQQPISLDYSGTLKGALNTLAALTNYYYTVNHDQINWSALQTKTFDISFMPGASNYFVGQDQNQNSTAINQSSNSGSPVSQINDQQYSNLRAALSVWRDLEKTISQLKSPTGKVIVSESTTSVTVHDRPNNVAAIQRYIEQLNRRLSQQVFIKVQVLDVQLNKDFNYGIDWNLLTNALGNKLRLRGGAGSATNLVNDNIISNSSNSAIATLGFGSNGNDVLIHALGQQGKVRIVTEPQVITLNNQIAAIRITQSVGYIESISQTSNQFFSTNAINPGSITDGFTLYILPKIQNNNVYMQISSTIANLQSLEKVSTAPADSRSNRNSQFQAIQVPTLNQKSFNQRSLVSSGSTLIIAGYKRLSDSTSKASFFGIDPLGGRGATTRNIETLVLITPTILHNSRSNVHFNT